MGYRVQRHKHSEAGAEITAGISCSGGPEIGFTVATDVIAFGIGSTPNCGVEPVPTHREGNIKEGTWVSLQIIDFPQRTLATPGWSPKE